MMIGINQGREFLEDRDLPSQFPDCVFVVLTEERVIIFCEPSVKHSTIEPHFDGFKFDIMKLYCEFNNDLNQRREYGVLKKRITKSNSNSPALNSPSLPEKTKAGMMLYECCREDQCRSEKILKIFYDTLNDRIIRNIPENPIFTSDPEKVIVLAANDILITFSFYTGSRF